MCDYTTELPTNISLSDDWEVGLVEVSFTRSWYNITTDQLVGIQDLKGRIYAKHPIKAGYYTIEELLTFVNHALSKHTITNLADVSSSAKDIQVCMQLSPELGIKAQIGDTLIPEVPTLKINRQAHRAEFVLGKDQHGKPVLPFLTRELATVFGFEDYNDLRLRYCGEGLEADFNPSTNNFAPLFLVRGVRSYDMEQGTAAIYIYSDIVEPQFLGDVMAPCISVCLVPSSVQYGQNCSVIFSNPSYVPVASRMFKTIRVSLKDKRNSYIPFEFGETIVKLHFRKSNAV